MNPSPAGLTAEHLTLFRRHRKILDAVSLQIRPGEFVALVGPNGSGKSTLLRCLNGTLRPASGTVRIDGQDVSGLSAYRLAQRLAFLPQENTVAFGFTVRELVCLGNRLTLPDTIPPLSGSARATTELTATTDPLSLLVYLELAALLDRNLLTLSGGERQRAAIARAFLQNTPYLLADEPTTHLDLRHQVHLIQAFRLAARQERKGVLAVLHDLNLAAYADRILMLKEGMIAAEGSPSEVLTPAILRDVYRTELQVHRGQGVEQIVLPIPGTSCHRS